MDFFLKKKAVLKQPKWVSRDPVCALIIDLDVHETPESGLLLFEKPPPSTTTPLGPKPPLHHSSPSPPRQRPRYLPCAPTGQRGAGRGQRRGLGRGQMFEDPAVMRIVQGRPSLKVIHTGLWWDGWNWLLTQCWNVIFFASPKSLDSAIVDCGKAMLWNSYEDDVSVDWAGHFLPALHVQLLFSLFCYVVHGALVEKDQKNLRIVAWGSDDDDDDKSTLRCESHQASLLFILFASVS